MWMSAGMSDGHRGMSRGGETICDVADRPFVFRALNMSVAS